MFCVKCGSRVPDGAAYCGGCGSPLPGAAAASNPNGWRPAAPVVVQPGPVIGGLPQIRPHFEKSQLLSFSPARSSGGCRRATW